MKYSKLIYIIFICLCFGEQVSASLTDSVRSISKNLPDSVKIDALNELCWKYNTTDPNLALSYGNKAIYLAIKSGDRFRAAESYSAIGVLSYYKSEYSYALQYFRKALSIRKKIGDKKGIASSLSNIALIYDVKGDYGKAIIYNLKALRIREEINDLNGKAKSLSNIGVIYFKQDKAYYTKALEYYNEALEIRKVEKDSKGVASLLNNIGMVYFELARQYEKAHIRDSVFETALNYFNKALLIRAEIKDVKGRASTLSNIGNIYGEKGDYEYALANYLKALSIHEEYGDKSGLANVLFNIAFMKERQGKVDEAIQRFKHSLKYALEIDEKEWILQNYLELAKIFNKTAQHEEAYDYLFKYSELKDTLFSLKSSNQIAEMQAKYEIDSKERQIELLKKDNEIVNLSLRRYNEFIVIIILSSALLLMAIVTLLIIRRNRYKFKEIEIVHNALNEKNVLIKEIHHRVKNNLQLINSLANLQFQDIEDADIKDKIEHFKRRIRAIAMLYDSLYKDENLNRIELEKFIVNLVESFNQERDFDEKVNCVLKIQKKFIDINQGAPLAIVLFEVVDNIFKHAFIKLESDSIPKVKIECFQEGKGVCIKISDNGIGISGDYQEGLGISIIKILVEGQLEGEIKYIANRGTEVHISF